MKHLGSATWAILLPALTASVSARAQQAPTPPASEPTASTTPALPAPASGPEAPASPAAEPAEGAATVGSEGTETPSTPEAGSAATPSSVGTQPAADEPATSAEAQSALDQFTSEEGSGDSDSVPLDLYGFADFDVRKVIAKSNSPWFVLFNRYTSAYVGNLNIYADKQITPKARALAEVRFTYLPNGARNVDLNVGSVSRQSSSYSDYTNFQRVKEVGGIIIEQVWLDYQVHPLLTVRMGQWPTPYSNWVVDHGSPVLIGITRPLIIGSELIPDHQVGVSASGGGNLSGALDWSYMAGISNGRTLISAFEDLDANKALTGRLALEYSELGTLDVGATVYYGRATDADPTLAYETDASGNTSKLLGTQRINYQMDELTFALDARWLYQGLHLQTEWLHYQRKFVEGHQASSPYGGLAPNRRKWGGYVLVGYRFDAFPIMPYLEAEIAPENTAEAVGIPDRVAVATMGVNYRPAPSLTFKAEYLYGKFTKTSGDPTGISKEPIQGLGFQAAWAF